MSLIPNWSEVTALFGGCFDPPHLGHREAARGLFQNPGIQKILVIPSASPPHKPLMTSPKKRLEMTRINFQSMVKNPFPNEVEVSSIEIERSEQNPQEPSYSFETIQVLKRQYPRLAFVLGADQFSDLSNWHRFPEILKLCHWLVLERKPKGNDVSRKVIHEWSMSGLISPLNDDTWQVKGSQCVIKLISTDAPELSSSAIRIQISRDGTPPAHSLLPEIVAYLKLHKAYGIKEEHDK